MFTSLLVANRGEIACRIFRTAQHMGMRTIAVYSEADAQALHVALADECVCLGPAPATESYLAVEKVIAAAKATGAEAIHPGYGFLSENADFAQACEAAGIIFVGPPASAIQTMGSKMASKRLMQSAGVPVLPGYHGENQDPEVLAQEAEKVGYPLLIKASAGGGGKGMRLVTSAADFETQLAGAKREAKAAFGSDEVLLERYLTSPKHIEVQLMADRFGQVIHLFERDCSVQRRHQKVIEEAPAPTVSQPLREALGATAIRVAQSVDYVGAGTVEFIAQDDEFFFMEMNTRLQVEHPVTEAITGLDLVEWQLRIAAGEQLAINQIDLRMVGHAIEVRLYAENPAKKFLPSTGQLVCFEVPEDIRTDTGVRAGDYVSPHYDPMLAKLIAHGPDRTTALARLSDALRHAKVAGVEHNLGYLNGMLGHPDFVAGDYTTSLAEQVHDEVVPDQQATSALLAALFVLERARGDLPWCQADGFRTNLPARKRVLLRQGKQELQIDIGDEVGTVNGGPFSLYAIHAASNGRVSARVDGRQLVADIVHNGQFLYVMCAGHTERFIELTDDISRYQHQSLHMGGITSPMPGQIVSVNVEKGQAVRAGDLLVVVEAMKMEHSIVASKAGVVARVFYATGDRVEEGAELIALD